MSSGFSPAASSVFSTVVVVLLYLGYILVDSGGVGGVGTVREVEAATAALIALRVEGDIEVEDINPGR